jgi:hypothetical protein
MVIKEPTFRMVPALDQYKLNAHGRLAWLHRLLWRALAKMGALKSGIEEKVTYKTYTIDADRVIERVMEAQGRLYRATGPGPRKILIGPAEVAELMQDASLQDFSYAPDPVRFEGQRQFRGMTVEIIPHMQGVLVR